MVVLSARDQNHEKGTALDAGAIDYLTKPFDVDELLARLRALPRRRTVFDTGTVAHFGDVEGDLARHEIRKRGEKVRLTPTEYRLLAALLRARGVVLTYRQLLHEAWGQVYADRIHHLRVHMANLRQKLEDDPARPRYLITELQVGYRLTDR